MGRQVNFYMASDDEENFAHMFLETDVLRILSGGPSPVPDPAWLSELPPVGQRYGWSLYIVPRTLADTLQYSVNPTLRQYRIDPMSAPVIEFSRSRVANRLVSRGRLWVELRPYGADGIPNHKSDELGRHFERLAKFIRKTYRKDGPFYVGPAADRLIQEGYGLAP